MREVRLDLTWIGHDSFLAQFTNLNALIDPDFANWLFWQKRLKKAGIRLRDLPLIDLVFLTHTHFDHFHLAETSLSESSWFREESTIWREDLDSPESSN